MAGRPNRRRAAPAMVGAARTIIALAVAMIASACSTAGPPNRTPAALTVFAAASLRNPLVAIATAYDATSGVRLAVVTDSSTTLRTQLELGARSDVFLSADTANPEALAAAGLVNGAVVPFAATALAIIVPLDNPAGLAGPFDLARPGVAVVAAGDGVPITTHAAELLRRLATLPGAPPGFSAAYATNVVTREDNAGSVLARIELGEGDAAIVYATDAAASGAVASLPIPAGVNVTAVYAGAVMAAAADRAAAHAFLDWLAGPDGQGILASFGFEVAR